MKSFKCDEVTINTHYDWDFDIGSIQVYENNPTIEIKFVSEGKTIIKTIEGARVTWTEEYNEDEEQQLNKLEQQILNEVKKFPKGDYRITKFDPDPRNRGMDVHFTSPSSIINSSGFVMGTGITGAHFNLGDDQKIHIDYPEVTTSIDFGRVMKGAGHDNEANNKVAIVERGMGVYIT